MTGLTSDPELTVLCHSCHSIFASYAKSLPPSILNQFRYHIPSPFSSAEILSLAQTDLSRYDSEIERTEEILRKLRLERQELHDYMLPHHAVFAPIRAVPNEILREIFVHACEENDLTLQSLPPAMTIMRVCSHWYTLALSTKHMWSRFSVRLPSRKSSIEDILLLYLDRSKDAPLRFHMEITDGRVTARNILLEKLAVHSHRWIYASFNVPSKLYPNLLPVKGRLPKLTTLGISRGNHDTAMFEDVPNLRTIVCHGFPNANLTIPWDQITSVVFSRCWIGMASQTLSFCPNLTHVEFSSCFRFQKDEDPERYQVNLTSMLITSAENGDVWKANGLTLLRGLLHGLTCPELEILDIRLHGPRAWSQPHVVAFLRRSECKLATLRLKNVVLTDSNLKEILNLCPTLTTLVVTEPFNPEIRSHIPIITHDIVSALTFAHLVPPLDGSGDEVDEPGSLLPKLQHLELSGGVSFSLKALLKLLESRTTVMEIGEETTLKSVYVRAHIIDEDEDVIARLREIRRGGLKMLIEVGQEDIKDILQT